MTTNFSRALDSYEARFTRGPADERLHTCTACRFEVDSLDARGECDDCANDPARIAAREVAVDDCGCDLCDAAQLEADLTADAGFDDWCAYRAEVGAELAAMEHDRCEAFGDDCARFQEVA